MQKESTASEKRRLEADKEKERVAKETEQEEVSTKRPVTGV